MKQPTFVVDEGTGETTRRLAAWVQSRIDGCMPFGENIQCLGFARGNRLIAAVVYSDFSVYDGAGSLNRRFPAGNVFINIAADVRLWCTPEVVSLILTPPFLHWGCTRITAVVRRDFHRSKRLARAVGFQVEGTMRRLFPGDSRKPEGWDGTIYGLLKEDFEKSRFCFYKPKPVAAPANSNRALAAAS